MHINQAREIASFWHGGQNSALYAFSSSGTITSGVFGEIAGCLRNATDEERFELDALDDFLRHPVGYDPAKHGVDNPHQVILGSAYRDDDARSYDSYERGIIRVYDGEDGSVWIGTDRSDIEYYCSLGHIPAQPNTRFVDDEGYTRDIESVGGDWPDYSVYCEKCGRLVHVGTND